ncbi:AAA family ATPase [Oharaeibacter diazotrophicus]|uniref:Putative ATPase n=1 Tax=Oharaeibacter diazotrophicus TaxID=1920512 RepID=A0A4R6R9K0_9HYPH|nr:AAA family ATPase [Oharaeibacter diazotrophicus]TDP82733.1 putative ATPase [Oharaeibacter diazotrophicus]BBE72505.1 glutamine ABC transporter ATP-binding protein [Pleomorphomonas sp. SM30]GLS76536.1 hypothetical protein GCM10007904_18730 [Oharaeibacter diazotrophicus]
MIRTVAISGYRSLRDLVVPLGSPTVVTGANGSGKSSLYRALRLLADVGQGRVVQSLALEGGLPAALWAGPEQVTRRMRRGEVPVEGQVRRGPVSLRLGFAGSDYGYAIDLGYPVPDKSAFDLDPVVKAETLWVGERLGRSNAIAERRGPAVLLRGDDHGWRRAFDHLSPLDSMLTHAADGRDGFELLTLRERLRGWRFYDSLRTDRDAPSRRPQVGTHTPVLAADGADLAAALQTIREIGDADGLDAAIADAFPGSRVEISSTDGFFETTMRQHGLLRPLRAAELSDGTLRYLLLAAALATPRPPELMVLNEPETSLHPDLIAPLARMLAAAATRSQVVVVTHADALAAALAAEAGAVELRLEKSFGETSAADVDAPVWRWPER